jgi:non-ribosomal peptide synthetase component E (peptide arylation enzyme)
MTTKIKAAMVDSDVATQAELDAEVIARNAAILAGNVKLSGDVVQVVNTQTAAFASGTGVIPCDDTIPQITEGTEFMTQVITPTSATNKLKIEVVVQLANSAASQAFVAALFQDSTANALAMQSQFMATLGGFVCISFVHFMTAGTTSATTFRVRCGASNAGTTSLNGLGARFYGGALASSITITEIKA